MRLRNVILANHAGLWGSALILAVLRLTYTANPGLVFSMAVLALGGLVLLIANYYVRREALGGAAAAIIVANWIPSIGATYVTPFITPVTLFGMLIPVVLLIEFISARALTRVGVVTVLGIAALAGLGESRRGAGEFFTPSPGVAALMVSVFVFSACGVVTVGLVQHTRRLTDQAAALESSRRRLTTAADEARRGIERDLHDGAQQRLSTLSVRLGRASRLLVDDPAQAREALATAQTELHEAIRELRDLAHGIYPMLLEQRGLPPALAAAARRAAHPCVVDAAGLGRYPAAVENAVYFCCLEAVHNADRHADPQRIDIRLRHEGQALIFTVRDDGAGFDASEVASSGLTGMADRIRAAGGTLQIDSHTGSGTVVSGWVPAENRSQA